LRVFASLAEESLEHPDKASTPTVAMAAAALIVLFMSVSFPPREPGRFS